MEVDLQTVRRVFEDVLAGRITREQADRWAYTVVQQEEAGTLVYSPAADKERIWSGVMYLYGVDILESPGEYLHSDDDIRTAMKEKLGDAQ
jgi:hypothetical protein